jgi:hypothetical protein
MERAVWRWIRADSPFSISTVSGGQCRLRRGVEGGAYKRLIRLGKAAKNISRKCVIGFLGVRGFLMAHV